MGIIVPLTEIPVYFISDAHLGLFIKGCSAREEHLISFLRAVVAKGKILFIVGDLFDFWVEYRFAIRPEYFPVLYELKRLVDNGLEVHYLAGNHDFMLGGFLEKAIGIHIHLDHYNTQLQGKKIHLFHGDGLIRHDVGYRILKKILRNPINQKLFKLLPPGLGVPLGSFCSGSSRKMTSKFLTEGVLEEYRRHAQQFLQNGSDIVVFAHTHRPEIRRYDGKIYCNSGEWIRQYTFAKLENGEMTLWKYCPDGSVYEIGESSLKTGASAS